MWCSLKSPRIYQNQGCGKLKNKVKICTKGSLNLRRVKSTLRWTVWGPNSVSWDSNVTFRNLWINLKLSFNFLHLQYLSEFMKFCIRKKSRMYFLLWKIYGKCMWCSYFVLRLGNRSLSQLVTVYPALPRQPAGDLFHGRGNGQNLFLIKCNRFPKSEIFLGMLFLSHHKNVFLFPTLLSTKLICGLGKAINPIWWHFLQIIHFYSDWNPCICSNLKTCCIPQIYVAKLNCL